MKNFTRHKKLGEHYLRYLLSYMTVLLIPLIILTFFYSSRFMKKFYEEIYETVDLELVQISTQMENELDTMQSISNQLTLTSTIDQAVKAVTPLDLDPVIASLSSFTSSNSFIQDIILIPDNNDYIATSTTTCQKDYFFDRIFHTPAMDSAELQDLLQNSSIPLCIPQLQLTHLAISSTPKSTVLFSYPLFTDYQRREGTVLFYVNSDSIQQLLSQKLRTYQAQIYLIDSSGTIVTTFGSQDAMRPFFENLAGQPAFPSGSAIIEQEKYIIRAYQSDISHWTYAAFIPDKQTTFSQVSDIMREFMLAIVIILLIASFTIFLLQRVNYAPMRRLRDKAKEISPTGTSTDELATISNALDYLSEQNSSLSSKLEGSLTAVKNERLYRLLGGDYATKEDFNLDCSELDLSLENNFFHVSILMLHTDISDIDAMAQEVKKQLGVSYVYYYLHYLHPSQIVLLLNLPKDNIRTHQLYQSLQSWLLKNHGILSTIGTGSIVDSTERIAQSYMEAASALDYRFVKGNGTLIEFREVLDPRQATMVYPHQEFEILRNALSSRSEQNIRSAIQNIIQFMDQGQIPLYLARSICFDLIHLVNEHSQGPKQVQSGSPLELSGMETALEIIQMLRTWSEQLSGFSGSSVKQAELNDILNYLNANCLGCDFSVYEAALHFEMTLPAFSKYFKDSYGQNVMDYTIHRRMEKAKDLLKNTELPLKDIAEQVGYYNLSSFTRRFKLSQGVTPGEYRKMSATSIKTN